VDVNRGEAIRLAVRHLAALGHRRIAYIGEPKESDPMQTVKIKAFLDEAARRGLELGPDAVLRLDGLEFHDGYLAAQAALSREAPPTAVISGGIDLTRGILRAAVERGLQVPGDLSIVSYDNLPQMEDLDVPMTVVGVPLQAIASAIGKTILELIEAPDTVKTVYLQPELVVRASTAAPSRQ
jgi:LacI family transcriptional regulator